MDFHQARIAHIGFKSKLRSILYGNTIDETPVLSEHECALGKWIYSHALPQYGSIPEMQELEEVHRQIHTVARELLALYDAGEKEKAREGLARINEIAEQLINLLTVIEKKAQG